MATVRDATTCKLTARVEMGVTESGTTKYGDRSLSNANPSVTDDDARTIIDSFAALQSYPLSRAIRSDSFTLLEQA